MDNKKLPLSKQAEQERCPNNCLGCEHASSAAEAKQKQLPDYAGSEVEHWAESSGAPVAEHSI